MKQVMMMTATAGQRTDEWTDSIKKDSANEQKGPMLSGTLWPLSNLRLQLKCSQIKLNERKHWLKTYN
jgi:hypothetical protein